VRLPRWRHSEKVSMNEQNLLAEQFEAHRAHLAGVAYRMLGSQTEADDAVQEAWLRLSHSGTAGVENLGGWLTTVVARVCLDMLRSRKSRREESLEAQASRPAAAVHQTRSDPANEALLADSVGVAMLVVLETLAPAERVAFVLHDMFDIPFGEIASIVGRSPTAARQLASRARRRVRGRTQLQKPDLVHQREIVDAFLAASREGDFEALLAVLDPEVVAHADSVAVRRGAEAEVHGSTAVARAVKGRAVAARPALVNGSVGIVVAPRGKLLFVICLKYKRGKIAEFDVIAEPERLRQLDLAVLGE
jgi:RNA polymerase sigma-70 factor, ECF subfamily